jgi:geranylgeranyl diphosphate synthase type II
MELSIFLQNKAAAVDGCLHKIIPEGEDQAEIIFQAMRYSIFAGGKRLRPALFCATLAALGKDDTELLPFAAALEMIHTYSLIHDDLPAMDNDDLRRGKPTCHKVFGEAQAILAGDALLTYAFNAMISIRHATDSKALLTAIDEVAYSAGVRGMIIGQVVDIAWEGEQLSEAQLEYMHRHKTGALFRASILSAAILAGANKEELAALTEYSGQIGLAFQIADDILDVTGNEASLGKPLGSDAKNNKTTYASLLGIDKARKLGLAAANAAVAALAIFDERANILRQMAGYFIKREY